MPKIVDSTDIRELGENILRKRLENRMTQEDLGYFVGVSGNTVHLYESAQIIMKVDKLFLLVDALGCTANDLCPERLMRKQVHIEMLREDVMSKFQKLSTQNQIVVLTTLNTLVNSMLEQQCGGNYEL